MAREWDKLNRRIVRCNRCPRLRTYCAGIARKKRRRFADWDYWAKPVPNFGEPSGRLLIVGLAPAAHGANRTGRIFTGDRSGDFLFQAMHAVGYANQPRSTHVGDGLELIDAAVTAINHCAPPDNKPTPQERENCMVHLEDTLRCMPRLKVIIALGQMAFSQLMRLYKDRGWRSGRMPAFAHNAVHEFDVGPTIVTAYHPSQQNTFTGKLTPRMLREVFRKARRLTDESPPCRNPDR